MARSNNTRKSFASTSESESETFQDHEVLKRFGTLPAHHQHHALVHFNALRKDRDTSALFALLSVDRIWLGDFYRGVVKWVACSGIGTLYLTGRLTLLPMLLVLGWFLLDLWTVRERCDEYNANLARKLHSTWRSSGGTASDRSDS